MKYMGNMESSSTAGNKEFQGTCVELFAGAGGLMLGLELAGFRTVVANEVHADPCKTLRHNFPHVPIVQGSIRDYTPERLFDEAGVSKEVRENIDLVAGGPPCQGFSTAGLKDINDPRNTLIGDYIRFVGEIRPKYFLLENVTGLISMHNGKIFESVLEELNSLGYTFDYKVFHAADYGIPQMRKRLIIIGSRDGEMPIFPKATHKSDKNTNIFDFDSLPYVTCGDALGDLPEIDAGDVVFEYDKQPETAYQRYLREDCLRLENHETSKHKEETKAYYSLVPAGGTSLDIPIELRKKKQGIQRWPLNGLARTITTEPTDFLHPTLNRIPSVRELARIQSFPDRFVFLGQRTTGNTMRKLGYCSQTQQVGNAVPPLLAKVVGEAIALALSKKKIHKAVQIMESC